VEPGALYAAETAEAPGIVARQFAANAGAVDALAIELRAQPPRLVLTSARGSSDNAATNGRYLIEAALGIVVASASPSLASVYEVQPNLEGALHISISQSGRSADLLAAARAARAGGARTVALLNDTDAPLAALVDHVLPLLAGPEGAVAATKSCIAAFACLLQLVAAWSEDAKLAQAVDALPDALARVREANWNAPVEPLATARHLFVIGRGIGLAAAQELALKFKETCALHAEAFSAAEVLHGPSTLVGPEVPVLVLVQDDAARTGTLAVADELAERGGQVWIVATDGDLRLPPAPAAAQPILMLQSGYALAGAVARARGTDPDRPPYLSKVTSTR